MSGSAFVGVWNDNPRLWLVDNIDGGVPILLPPSRGQITITEVITDAFYRVHVIRENVNLYNTIMYNDGVLCGLLDKNNYATFYFENDQLIQKFQQISEHKKYIKPFGFIYFYVM
jgi:hypothetical protein